MHTLGILEVYNLSGQSLAVCQVGFLAFKVLAYLVILAKGTAQVAIGEKDRAGAVIAGYSRLFTQMVAYRSHYGGVSAVAVPAFGV
jgi:hypothetical protein